MSRFFDVPTLQDLRDLWDAEPDTAYIIKGPTPPEVAVRTIPDLRQVHLQVSVVRFGWRARLASYLIRLGAWVGGSSLRFEGDKNG